MFEDIDLNYLSKVAEHSIYVVPGIKPIYTQIYILPKIHEEEVKTQINKLLTNGTIKESIIPWNSPLWVVPVSAQLKWSVVIDYRKFDELTTTENYPLPNISDILYQFGRVKYFSTIDLRSGIHQIPVKREDQCKTAFSTPYGHYEYTRMPFGLIYAPACFQRMMNSEGGLRLERIQVVCVPR